mgnify:CR=1 FL=1
MSKDYYKILGVDKSASQDDIKKAFRKLAHQYHPDKKGGDEARFKEINEAYQVLGDSQKRSQYDKFGSTFENAQASGGFQGFEGFRDFSGFANGHNINMDDLGDIFGGIGDIFGFGGGRTATKNRPHKGRDVEMAINIEFIEAVFGSEKEIAFEKNTVCDKCRGDGGEPGSSKEKCQACGGRGRVLKVQRTIFGSMQVEMACSTCGGEGEFYARKCSKCGGSGVIRERSSLKVKIPAGIADNEVIKFTGQGEAGFKGGVNGDLYIRVKVRPHPKFTREGYDIHSRIHISITQAVIGDKVDVETVDGTVKLSIPEGTESGKVFIMRGKGVPKLHGYGRGDHLVEVVIRIPKNLSRKAKETLKELGI